MKKFAKLTAVALAAVLALGLVACGGNNNSNTDADGTVTYKIAVPNDTTNEARALQLLEANGVIKFKDGADKSLATKLDVESAGDFNIEIVEVEAAQVASKLADVDFAVINSNYAIDANLSPLTTEGTDVSYPNVLAVKAGNETTDKTKALIAAVTSQQVVDFIAKEYNGAIVSDIVNPTNGFDSTVDYDALAGTTITVAATPNPHVPILEVAKTVLAEKGITLDIKTYTDYVQPNQVVNDGQIDANFFQHQPYLDNFNQENNTNVVSVALIHHEPMGIYAGRSADLGVFAN